MAAAVQAPVIPLAPAALPPPPPPPNSHISTVWAYVRIGLDEAMALEIGGRLDHMRYMSLYTVAYNYAKVSCRDRQYRHSWALYRHFEAYLREKLNVIRTRIVSDAGADENAFLASYSTAWEHFSDRIGYIDRVFGILVNYKNMAAMGERVYPLVILANIKWHESIIHPLQKSSASGPRLTDALMAMVRQHRAGKTIDQDLFKAVLNSLVKTGPKAKAVNHADPSAKPSDYVTCFEATFIAETKAYCLSYSAAHIGPDVDVKNPNLRLVSAYLTAVEERIGKEEEFARACLPEGRHKPLLDILYRVFIWDHSDLLLDAFYAMLDARAIEDMKKLYALSKRIQDGVEMLEACFTDHVSKTGFNGYESWDALVSVLSL